MTDLLAISKQLLSGALSTRDPDYHPFSLTNAGTEIAPDVFFFKTFVNVTAVRTSDGLVLVDTGPFNPGIRQLMFDHVRAWSPERVCAAIYTHGHVDHAYGLPPYLAEAHEKSWATPEIIGHRAVSARMDRYVETAGYNGVINSRQFSAPITWPTDPIHPTTTYADQLAFARGDTRFELTHARGETDDHTYVFLPRQRVLCTGDLFIWGVPNAGNPQKVQRYCADWIRALRRMASLEPEILLPGHGFPITGREAVSTALLDTASYLESLYDQTVALMNHGATVDEIIHTVTPPPSLTERPYLQPIYDEPEFIVRNIYRCLGGWYDGIPSELKPAPRTEQAREIATLCGGISPLLTRARDLATTGNFRMACHLVDWAQEAEPNSPEVRTLRAEIYTARAATESSTMARGIFNDTARRSSNED